ncbi:MAG: cytochrome-c peroxidase [Proteobacteria bacterium]|nr:cytochrome-c peroxidase [Pseudomonadota bacterium]MBU1739026.1 cytochrome-c peroxidase [Pseudomonadota bacterium]
MKTIISFLVTSFVICLMSAAAFADEVSVELGQQLFNNPGLGASQNAINCNTCHPNGEGLEHAGGKANLAAIINKCIVGPLKGEKLNEQTVAMQSLMMYIQSLSK